MKTNKRSALRREARQLALQLLYGYDLKHCEDDGWLKPEGFDDHLDEPVRSFGHELFNGYRSEAPAVDAVVDERLNNWTLGRMAVLDRSLLRLGAYELLYCQDTPMKVIINEYIELAKQYGSEAKTAKLVNGVLDRIGRDYRR